MGVSNKIKKGYSYSSNVALLAKEFKQLNSQVGATEGTVDTGYEKENVSNNIVKATRGAGPQEIKTKTSSSQLNKTKTRSSPQRKIPLIDTSKLLTS